MKFDELINDAGSLAFCDDDIANAVVDNEELCIKNPPIDPPAFAVIVPCNITSPSLSKWKLLDVISILPFDPDIKFPAALLPKKNVGVLISRPASVPVENLKNDSECSTISKPVPL